MGAFSKFACLVALTFLSISIYGQNLNWVHHLGGSQEDLFKAMATDGTNFYAGGKIGNTVNVYYSHPDGIPGILTPGGAFVAKFTKDGQCIWSTRIKDATGTVIPANSIVNSVAYQSGFIYVTGHYITGAATKNFFISKINAATGVYTSYYKTFVGGDGTSVVANSSGIFVTGYYVGTGVTISSAGSCISSYTIPASSTTRSFIIKFIECAGGVLKTVWGNHSSHVNVDGNALALSPSGADLYLTGSYGALTGASSPINFSITAVGDIITNGTDLFVAKFNPSNGTCIWIRHHGNPGTGSVNADYGYGIVAENDGAYFTGKAANVNIFGGFVLNTKGAFVARYSASGGLIFAKGDAPVIDLKGYGICILDDKIFITGENFYWKVRKSDGSLLWSQKINNAAGTPLPVLYGVSGTTYGDVLSSGISSTGTYVYGDGCGGCTPTSFAPFINTAFKDGLICRIDPDEILLTVDFTQTHTVAGEMHGSAMVAYYTTCTDDICFENFEQLKPGVVRFPSSGDAQFYNLSCSRNDWGIVWNGTIGIESYFNERYGDCVSDVEIAGYTPVDDLWIGPDCISLTNDLTSLYDKYLEQTTGAGGASYLNEFKKTIKDIEDERPDETVNVIYVANIFSASPADLVETIRELENNSPLYPCPLPYNVDVVGIELGNEVWGTINDDLFPDAEQYFYYVTNNPLYSGPLSLKGNYIQELRDYDESIKIGFPMAPLNVSYGGVDLGTESHFIGWNSDLQNLCDDYVGGYPAFDSYVGHFYFDDKFWDGPVDDCLPVPGNFEPYSATQTGPYLYGVTPDPTIQPEFDCMLEKIMRYINGGTLGGEEYGFNHVILKDFVTDQLSGGCSNKELWVTEWNLLEKNHEDHCKDEATETDDINALTRIYHNTFLQSVLVFNWTMEMYESNWESEFAPNTDFFKFSTFFNGVSENENGIISRRKYDKDISPDPGNQPGFGEGIIVDSEGPVFSADVRRITYYTQLLMRDISLQHLKWVKCTYPPIPGNPYLKIYTYYNPSSEELYFYYCNPGNADEELNLDFIYLAGLVPTADVVPPYYREYFNVNNDYSTAGYNYLFELNESYFDCENKWKDPLPGDPLINDIPNEVNENTYFNYDCTGDPDIAVCVPNEGSVDPIILHRKSLGLIKIDVNTNLVKTDEELLPPASADDPYTSRPYISAYPNPFSQEVKFEIKYPIDNNRQYSLRIYDLFGQLLDELVNIKSETIEYHNSIKTGIYFFEFSEDGKTLATGKLIKID